MLFLSFSTLQMWFQCVLAIDISHENSHSFFLPRFLLYVCLPLILSHKSLRLFFPPSISFFQFFRLANFYCCILKCTNSSAIANLLINQSSEFLNSVVEFWSYKISNCNLYINLYFEISYVFSHWDCILK